MNRPEDPAPIDYYYSVRSVYAYLGAARISELARQSGRKLRHLPMDLSQVVPAFGSTPFAERTARRRAHQFEVEVKRWSEWLQIPVILHPVHHHGDRLLPSSCVLAVQALGLDVDRFSLALLTALWQHDRDIGHEDVLASLAQDCGISPGGMLDLAHSEQIHRQFQQGTDKAITEGVPGSPTYIVDDELFFGQDRLMFVERHLTPASKA